MAPITPNPATTEWVPVWDLNGTGSGSGGGLHHVTHELGGTDVVHLDGSQIVSGTIPDVRLSSNVALKNINNLFSVPQTLQTFSGVSGSNSIFFLNDVTGPIDSKYWRFAQGSDGILYIQALNDDATTLQGHILIFRDSSLFAPSGLRNTPLNASQLTLGTIPDARLSSNVVLKDQVNIFTQPQAIVTPSALLHLSDTSQPVDGKVWRIVNVGYLVIQATNDAVTVQQGGVTINRSGVLVAAGLGTTPLDASQLLSGTVPLARLPPIPSYEEGYFTPILGGTINESLQVYNIQAGNYVKIGNFVHAGIYVQFSNNGIINGNLVIKNLPYPSGGGSPTHAAAIGYITNLGSPGTVNPRRNVHGYMLAATTQISLFSGDDLNATNGNMIQMTGIDTNIHTQLILSISYRTNY